jgi:DNA polymerase III subunit epsilon
MSNGRFAVVEEAAQLLKNGCVMIDLETTGFVHPEVEIVEVAVINHLGEILLNTLVKPVGKIPASASAIHGIFDSHVAESPTFPDIYPDLLRCVTGQPVVAYNYSFEQGILEAVCNRHGQALLTCNWHCAMRDYAVFKRLSRFSKLTDACWREGVEVKDAHRALGDCFMTLGLLRKMAGVKCS